VNQFGLRALLPSLVAPGSSGATLSAKTTSFGNNFVMLRTNTLFIIRWSEARFQCLALTLIIVSPLIPFKTPGTPTTLVNGKLYPFAPLPNELREMIKTAIANRPEVTSLA